MCRWTPYLQTRAMQCAWGLKQVLTPVHDDSKVLIKLKHWHVSFVGRQSMSAVPVFWTLNFSQLRPCLPNLCSPFDRVFWHVVGVHRWQLAHGSFPRRTRRWHRSLRQRGLDGPSRHRIMWLRRHRKVCRYLPGLYTAWTWLITSYCE